jgi:hypothetical protein
VDLSKYQIASDHGNMLKQQACQGIFGMAVDRPAAARVASPGEKPVPGKFPRTPVLPKLLPLIAIAAILLLAAAERWYWHESAPTVAAQTLPLQGQRDGRHDFDFYAGKWRLHNRRLVHPLTGSKEWVEFDGTSVAHKMWDGRANVDEFEANTPSGPVEGMTLRLYNADTREWSLYRADSKAGVFSAPAAVGHFVNGRGEFYEHEEIGGERLFVRLLWEVRSPKECHWEQAFSTDEGRTWETNWIIDSSNVEGPAL